MIVDKPFIDMLVIIMNKKKNFTKLQFQNPNINSFDEDIQNLCSGNHIKVKK